MSGPFNQTFWQVDVPTAAQAYPSVWHAGMALASILQATESQNQHKGASLKITSTKQYVFALTHFNKSIQHLARTVGTKRDNTLSYMDKEMIIMTHILYIGICSMLADPEQISAHFKNFILLLERLRFGEEDPASRRGILTFDNLLSIVLALDASIDSHEDFKDRKGRDWVVKAPRYHSFASLQQAYLGFLPFLHKDLFDKGEVEGFGFYGPDRYAVLRRMMYAYQAKLKEFGESGLIRTTADRQSFDVLTLHIKVLLMVEDKFAAKSREGIIKEELKLMPILDQIDSMCAEATPLPEPYAQGTPPILFAPAFGSMMQSIVSTLFNPAVRRKGIDLMRKWPFKEISLNSRQRASFYSAVMEHERTGPERTRASQLAGNPIIPTFSNGGLAEGTFDGSTGCECIPGVFSCREHKLGEFVMRTTSKPPAVGLRTWYEMRLGWETTYYPIEY